jgi:hypothetical protein
MCALSNNVNRRGTGKPKLMLSRMRDHQRLFQLSNWLKVKGFQIMSEIAVSHSLDTKDSDV